MASAGSSFDFASDDVLCSFDEVVSHDLSSEKRSVELEKDLEESGIGRELVCVYREEEGCPKEEIIDVVEKCMKKFTDSLIQHFEGMNGRLTQLEIQCYKLERSMGEFRADSIHDQGEVNAKLKAVSKQLHEVHRSIQIIRDKQELAETQNELTKLQAPSKESNSPTQSQKSDMSSLSSASEPKQHTNTSENPQLALALPHQIIHPHDHQQHYTVNQPLPFYPQQPEPHYIQTRAQIPGPQQQQQLQNPPQHQSFVLASSNYTQSKPQLTDPNFVLKQTQTQPTFVYMQARPDHPVQALPLQQPPLQTVVIRAQAPAAYPAAFAYGAPGCMGQPQLQGYSAAVYRSMDSGRVQQVVQVHPYADVIEKAAGVGYSREQAVDAVNELVDRGRFVDFNALLDRLQGGSGAWTQ